jgi:preprotein translocase subunit SecD
VSTKEDQMTLRNRILVIVAVLLSSVWALYPAQETIKLGLDLKGGLHLVLQVQTDDALELETQTTVERLRETLTRNGVQFARIEAIAPTEFTVEGVNDETAFRDATPDVETVFDRTIVDGAHTFRMRSDVAVTIRQDTVRQAQATIERRVNELGVAEAVVARYGSDDRILVELPGVTDVERAKQIIKSTAQLRLTLVERGPFPTREAALLAYDRAVPTDLDVLPGRTDGGSTASGDAVYWVVRKTPAVSGSDLRNAQQSVDEFNRPAVAFTLTPDAARRFGSITAQNINRTLATVVDGRVTSVATIVSRIDDRGQIAGVTRDEMVEQVVNLKSGALPADLEYIAQRTIGASLGESSVRAGVLASAGGLTLVMLLMLAIYKRTGLNALVSVVLNLTILMALVAFIPVTMTLPGIAGLILTIGMGVDSNVLIFERIKEELAAARSARAAVDAAFGRVWVTIVDTHVASLIAAAFLFQFGTSPIRGFATTLTIGLLANVFTAVFVSRTMFELTLSRRRMNPQALSI